MRRATVLSLVLLTWVTVGGCGTRTPQPLEGSETSTGSSTMTPGEPNSTPSRSMTPTTEPPTSPMPTKMTGFAVTLTGTASRAAVEGTCLLLTVAGRSYLLVGKVAGIRVGDRVTVTGHVDRGVVTTCQTGTPFVVERVGAAEPSSG